MRNLEGFPTKFCILAVVVIVTLIVCSIVVRLFLTNWSVT